MTTLLSAPEQARARYPDEEGYAERDGVRVFWERYGEGEPTILLPPTWEIVHSRFWKGQIPYLARHTRVVTFDPRGNGRSDRPEGFDAYRRRVPTAKVNAVIRDAQLAHAAPGGARVLYAVQGAAHPPTFTLFVNKELPRPYLRYLERKLREAFDLGATAVKLRVRRRGE